VTRDTGDLDDQLGAATVADADVTVRGFTDDDRGRTHFAGRDQPFHAPAAALFEDRVSDDDVARRTVLDESGRRVRLDRERPLDVHGAPAVQETVGDDAVERRVLPAGLVADVDDVEVTAEHDGRRFTAAAYPADRAAVLVDPRIIEAERFELATDPLGDVSFRSRRTRDADQLLRE
jgi:hypothetical protein